MSNPYKEGRVSLARLGNNDSFITPHYNQFDHKYSANSIALKTLFHSPFCSSFRPLNLTF
ncbi:MAG: hypothetical protein ABR89_10450 [Rhodobacter sp. BACL10 MAG-120910-bin24]|nr:MAG: hypothetical protein ABR89_10450 [Rhodobacter sp. BACL10 MAG-120910-bin24]